MPQFSYTAQDSDGKMKEGTVTAESLENARDALKELSLTVQEIHETTMAENAIPWEVTGEQLTPEKAEKLFSAVAEPSDSSVENSSSPASAEIGSSTYFPLIDTLRLYAGWLLAWYFLVYAIGSYTSFRLLPFDIPFLEGLFLSPLVLSFTFAAWLFLLLSGMWKKIEGSWKSGLLFTLIGIGVFVVYRMNVI